MNSLAYYSMHVLVLLFRTTAVFSIEAKANIRQSQSSGLVVSLWPFLMFIAVIIELLKFHFMAVMSRFGSENVLRAKQLHTQECQRGCLKVMSAKSGG